MVMREEVLNQNKTIKEGLITLSGQPFAKLEKGLGRIRQISSTHIAHD